MRDCRLSSRSRDAIVRAWLRGLAYAFVFLACGSPSEAAQQGLQLSVSLGKAEFFEDEPVYVVFRLANTGPDTVWTGLFELMPDMLSVQVTRGDGTLLPGRTVWADYAIDPSWRGIALPPGESHFRVVVLQESWGDLQTRGAVFLNHLPRTDYKLTASFNPNIPTAPSPTSRISALVVAQPVSFTVRQRSASEEAAYREVVNVWGLLADGARRGRYMGELLRLAEQRLQRDSSDPYVAYLLRDGAIAADVAGLGRDPATRTRLTALRVATALAQRNVPAGAVCGGGCVLRGPAPRSSAVSAAWAVSGGRRGWCL